MPDPQADPALGRLPPRWWQRWLLPALALAALALLAAGATGRLALGLAVGLAIGAVAGAKLLAILVGALRRSRWCSDLPLAEDDPALPRYSVLVPLYREADAIGGLLEALAALRWPRDRFEALLLIEPDDAETAAALAGRALPPGVRAVVLPPGIPRTKPRACNAGLELATGDLVVVFDAEDRPEPDQLLRAAAAFRRLPPQVVCLQARLNAWNRGQGPVARGFAIEYATWFDLILPGLHAVGAPIPLGGTSNHFRGEALRRLRWDPWNVTEDCELGIRLARQGLATAILDSTTWEEAPERWGSWFRQRSRWMKGHWQTVLAHTREPFATLRELGAWRSAWMALTVGGQVLALLALPPSLLLAGAWLWWRWPLYDPHQPWTLAGPVAAAALALGNAIYILVHALAAWQRGFRALALWTPLMPVYWLLASLATWRGVWQAFRDPFTWEKTAHGVSAAMPPAAAPAAGSPTAIGTASPAPAPVAQRRPWLAATLVLALAGLVLATWRMPRWLGLDEEIAFAAIALEDQPLAAAELPVDACWSGRQRVTATVRLAGTASGALPVRALVHLKTLDGAWFQQEVRLRAVDGEARIDLPLADGWSGETSLQPWTADQLRRVRALGVRLYGPAGTVRSCTLAAVAAIGEVPQPPLTVIGLSPPATTALRGLCEIRFALSRTYANPFSPADIDLWGEFSSPGGTVARIPAFHGQDYRRRLAGGREILDPLGAPYWAVRWRPQAPGAHRFRLVGRDRAGATIATATQAITVEPSTLPGAMRIAADGRHFAREDGSFCYPIGLNLRSPHDTLVAKMPGIDQPADAEGTFVYDRWFARMAANRMDFARLWLAPGFLALEWSRAWPGYHGKGVYNLENAWRLDRLLAQARARGLLIELALWQHGPFTERYDSQWKDNPYNAANGGPLADCTRAMTDPATRAGFKDLLRYLAVRYGADPALFGWTMWIECDSVSKRGLAAWHAEMAAHLRAMNPGAAPISAEFITATGEADVWALPGIEYVQLPGYSGDDQVRTFIERATTLRPFAKPALIEEYGGNPSPGSVRWTAHLIHDGLWTGWGMRIAGAPLAWYWSVVFHHGLERHYRRFAAFIAGADLRGVDWQHRFIPVEGDPALRAVARCGGDRAWLWLHHPDPGRAGAAAYWRRPVDPPRPAGFDPLAADPGPLFPDRPGRALRLDQLGLPAGRYRIEVWDTWSDAPPIAAVADLAPGCPPWPLPPLTRDAAIRVVPER